MNPCVAFRRTSCLCMLLFSSVAMGCGAAPESAGGADRDPAATTGIFGTALYKKNVGPDHVVAFYEFDPGTVAVHESFSVDEGERPLLDGSWTFHSLGDVYKQLNPDTKDVPSHILDADRRVADVRASEAREYALHRTAARPVPPPDTPPMSAAAGERAFFSTAATTCSGDGFGDNWGETWFLNNFCNAGGFRWCPTNRTWANSGEYSAAWTSWRQMEGDFNLPGHISGTRISCTDYWIYTSCGPRTIYMDYDVLPRHVESWTFSDGNDRFAFAGTSQCGHQHTALLKSY